MTHPENLTIRVQGSEILYFWVSASTLETLAKDLPDGSLDRGVEAFTRLRTTISPERLTAVENALNIRNGEHMPHLSFTDPATGMGNAMSAEIIVLKRYLETPSDTDPNLVVYTPTDTHPNALALLCMLAVEDALTIFQYGQILSEGQDIPNDGE